MHLLLMLEPLLPLASANRWVGVSGRGGPSSRIAPILALGMPLLVAAGDTAAANSDVSEDLERSRAAVESAGMEFQSSPRRVPMPT